MANLAAKLNSSMIYALTDEGFMAALEINMTAMEYGLRLDHRKVEVVVVWRYSINNYPRVNYQNLLGL